MKLSHIILYITAEKFGYYRRINCIILVNGFKSSDMYEVGYLPDTRGGLHFNSLICLSCSSLRDISLVMNKSDGSDILGL